MQFTVRDAVCTRRGVIVGIRAILVRALANTGVDNVHSAHGARWGGVTGDRSLD